LVSRLRRSVLIALCAGVLVGVAAYLAGPWLCTAAGGLAGFMTSLAVQARQAAQRLTAATSASRP
jgi:hypothetical protein